MNNFLAIVATSITPQVVFAMLGGLIGSLISSDRKRYGWQLSLLFCIVAIFTAAGMGDYMHHVKKISSIWWMMILNVPLGMVIGATLDAIRITSPKLIESLVDKVGNSAVSIIGDSILSKLTKIFGSDVVVNTVQQTNIDINKEKES